LADAFRASVGCSQLKLSGEMENTDHLGIRSQKPCLHCRLNDIFKDAGLRNLVSVASTLTRATG